MKHYAEIKGGYILYVSDTPLNTEIAAEMYAEITRMLSDVPHKDGKVYKLKSDLTWEEFDAPLPADDISAEEVLADLEALL